MNTVSTVMQIWIAIVDLCKIMGGHGWFIQYYGWTWLVYARLWVEIAGLYKIMGGHGWFMQDYGWTW